MRRCLNCMSEYLDQYEDRCPHCGYLHGTTQNGATDLPPGSILQGRYIVGTAIRSRDADIFYNGWDALFDRRVIIQEYFPKYCAARSANTELSIYDSKADVYQEGLALFYRQSRELIRFYKDEDMITYHACFAANKTAYAVMEYRNHKTLRAWLAERAVDSRDAIEILKEAIRITEKCHQAGWVHGMIDLDSLWVTGEGHLVLKDFGPWRYISGEPGVVSYRNVSAAADVYRLAVMFCQMVTGKRIEDAEKLTAELLKSRFQLKNHEVKALKNALTHDTQDLQTFRSELEGTGGAAVYASTSASASAAAKKRAKRRDAKHSLSLPKWAWAAAGAAALLVLAITIIGVRRIKLESETGELAQKEVRVPNVVGKDADQVEAMLKSMGLKMDREQMNYSDEIAEDLISYQVPAAGAVLEKGDSVVVHISKGKEKAEVPLVKGLDEEDAKRLLSEAGFSQVSIVEAPDSQLKYGTVLTITVEEEGTEKPKELVSIIDQLLGGKLSEAAQKKEDILAALDTKIVLTVSRHELQPEEIEVTVPELVGVNLADAQAVLETITEKELILQPQEEYSDRPAGEILSQKPKAGVTTKDSYITIVVSKGKEKVSVINVELMTKEEAGKELESQGLKVGAISEAYSDSIAKDKVISQSVDADEQVAKGTAIDLVISKGAKPAAKTETKKATKKNSKPKATTAPKTTTEAAPTEEVVETSDADKSEGVFTAESESAKEEAATETAEADGKANAIEVGAKPSDAKEPGTTSKTTAAEESAAAETKEAETTTVPTAASAPEIIIDPNPGSTAAVNTGNSPGGTADDSGNGASVSGGPGQ